MCPLPWFDRLTTNRSALVRSPPPVRPEPVEGRGQTRARRLLPQPHAGAAAVLVDERDPGGLKSLAYENQRAFVGRDVIVLEVANRGDADLSLVCKVLLAPFEETASGTALGGRDHAGKIGRLLIIANGIAFLVDLYCC